MSDPLAGAIPLATFAATFLGTLLFRRVLIRYAMIDVPSERSSHTTPVPRGGGIVFVVGMLAAISIPIATGALPAATIAGVAGIVGVATIGFIDDRKSVGAAPRLAVHMLGAAAAIWAATFGVLQPSDTSGGVFAALIPLGTVLLLALIAAWFINLVNFMDGIDGLAAMEGVFVCASAAMLSTAHSSEVDATRDIALAVAAAVAGFGLVNISRARIFMGDAGSGALGLVMAWLLATLALRGGLTPLAAITLPAVFVVDATTTLAVRVVRREHPARAHRTHAYQRLVRDGRTHLAVTGRYLAINMFLVLPIASFVQHTGATSVTSVTLVMALYCGLTANTLRRGAGREPHQAELSREAGKVNASA